ncbi:MAG: RecX family transcriptional regulator [Ignavibacteria bacterium]|nr:RecX family transcriptional regulator [Ignavibacteria bacterium]
MLITKIERQKKDRKRYNLYLDGEFYCGLYDDTILKYGIASGDETTEAGLEEIKGFDEYIYGKKLAFNFLSYRIRTISEIRKKLHSKKISESSIEKVLAHLGELGLTNDTDFARQFINEKLKRNPVGKKVLKQKLFEKGIPAGIAEEVIEKLFGETDEKLLAMVSFDKYYTKLESKAADINEKKRKVYDHLARKGFDYHVINEIIREKIT